MGLVPVSVTEILPYNESYCQVELIFITNPNTEKNGLGLQNITEVW